MLNSKGNIWSSEGDTKVPQPSCGKARDQRLGVSSIRLMCGLSRCASWIALEHMCALENLRGILMLKEEKTLQGTGGRDPKKVVKSANV